MTRQIEFVKGDDGALSGFLMHADPIRDIVFGKVQR